MFEINDDVLDTIGKKFTIPPKPEMLGQLQGQLSADEPDIGIVADVISQDIGIAASVLKIVNTPAFGLSRTVSDIKQSVMFIGLRGISSLVTGLLLKQAFNQDKCCISLERFWDHAVNVANVAVHVGQSVKHKFPIEDLYAAALFMDCGIPAMAIQFSDYNQLLMQANEDLLKSLITYEEKKYQTNHAVVGYYIAASWNLPPMICSGVLNHQNIEFLKSLDDSEEQVMFAVLKMSENIVSNHKQYRDTSDWRHIKAAVFDVLGCDEDTYKDVFEDVIEGIM